MFYFSLLIEKLYRIFYFCLCNLILLDTHVEYTGNSKRKKQVVDFDAQKKKIGTRDNKDKRPQNNRDNINNRNTHEKKPMRKPNEYKNKIEPRAQNTNNNVNHHIYRYHDGFRVPN